MGELDRLRGIERKLKQDIQEQKATNKSLKEKQKRNKGNAQSSQEEGLHSLHTKKKPSRASTHSKRPKSREAWKLDNELEDDRYSLTQGNSRQAMLEEYNGEIEGNGETGYVNNNTSEVYDGDGNFHMEKVEHHNFNNNESGAHINYGENVYDPVNYDNISGENNLGFHPQDDSQRSNHIEEQPVGMIANELDAHEFSVVSVTFPLPV